MSRYKVCFVPTCPNNWKTAPEKTFLFVTDSLKRRWCMEYNIKYVPRNCFCCEDHLNLRKDLENYTYWKFMNWKPILKETATLILKGQILKSNLSDSLKGRDPSGQQTKNYNLPQRNIKTNQLITESRIRESVNVSLQCKVPTAERSTHKTQNSQKVRPFIASKSPNAMRRNRMHRELAEVHTHPNVICTPGNLKIRKKKPFLL